MVTLSTKDAYLTVESAANLNDLIDKIVTSNPLQSAFIFHRRTYRAMALFITHIFLLQKATYILCRSPENILKIENEQF